MRTLLALTCCCVLSVGGAQTDLRPIVEQALDQPIDLAIDKAPVLQAFQTIGDETGVTVTLVPGVVDLLPYGPQTEVTAEFRNISLRDGLDQLLGPLGMTYDVTDNGLEVFPTPALDRLGRRATWPELRALQWLHAARFDSDDAMNELKIRLQFQLAGQDPWSALSAAIRKIGAGTGDDLLEVATRSLGWTWYPWGEQIVILPLADQVRRQLPLRLSIRKAHRPLVEVLREVGRQGGVTIRLGDGVAAALPTPVLQSFTLFADNVSVEEALEEIAAATGLDYRIEADTVVFTQPGGQQQQAALSTAAPERRRDPYVAKISLPGPGAGYQIDFLLRESDLSPEVNAMRKKLINEANQVMEEALRKRFEENQ